MIVTTVFVFVKEEHVQDFINASIDNHKGSVDELGNLRFDVLQSKNDKTRFLLYEAYSSEETAAAHKQTDHYLKWKETVETWMAKPREGIPHNIVTPLGLEDW